MSLHRRILIALSLANLCFVPVWALLLDGSTPEGYYLQLSTGHYVAAILNVLVLAALFTAAAACALSGRPLVRWLMRLAFLLALLIPLRFLYRSLGTALGQSPLTIVAHSPLRFAVPVVGVLLILAVIRWNRQVVRAAVMILLVLSPFAAVTIGRAAWIIASGDISHAFANEPSARHVTPPRIPPARVVLIVFDEWDHRMTFEERPARVRMPAMDRLRAESFYAERAYSPGPNTLASIPGLLSGHRIEPTGPLDSDELGVEVRGRRGVTRWSQLRTVFHDARARGFNTTLVGWYHPYCRMLGEVLTNCFWEPGFPAVIAPDHGFAQIVVDQWAGAFTIDRIWSGVRRVEVFEDLLVEARRGAADPLSGLVYIHLPIPHRPGIYDGSRQRLTQFYHWRFWDQSGGWYYDNLLLVDRTMEDLRTAMEASGVWESSAVIVTSDHSLREESFTTGSDPRVPFLLKLPGRHAGLSYADSVSTLRTRDLVGCLLSRELGTPEEIALWFESPGTSCGEAPEVAP